MQRVARTNVFWPSISFLNVLTFLFSYFVLSPPSHFHLSIFLLFDPRTFLIFYVCLLFLAPYLLLLYLITFLPFFISDIPFIVCKCLILYFI